MIECGRAVRDVSVGALSMEGAADRVVRMFYRMLVDRETGERNLVLVRCFKTHRYGKLPEDLAAMARGAAGTPLQAETPALTMLATAGELPEWNDRRSSRGHAAIPLTSVEMVERAPMISALLRQMGLKVEAAMYPTQKIILDADEHAFNVFHVQEALGDVAIPAQDEFVRPHGVKSVLGFGGLLPTGELFAVIMFARVAIPRQTADLFRTISLGVKLALLPFARGPIFNGEAAGMKSEEEEQRSELATTRLLTSALEEAALRQTQRLQSAVEELRDQSTQMRLQGLQLNRILEATTDSVMMLDRNWRFTYANAKAMATVHPVTEVLGRVAWEAFPGMVFEGSPYVEHYYRAMDEGIPGEFEAPYGDPINVIVRVQVRPSMDGIVVFFRDVTNQKKSADALIRTEKLAAVGRLAASIAHEINNPLEAVTNLLYLARGSENAAEVQGYLKTAEQELQRVSVIANQTLRFNKQATNPMPIACEDLIESVLPIYQGRLASSEVRVERRNKCACEVQCFDGEIRQVLSNLVGNAIDAMSPGGGRLLVRNRSTRDWDTGRPGVVFTVADTGSGIPPEALERIFDPFFTTKGFGGTGLGLWVSHEIAKRHHGSLRVRSSIGKGTVFTLFLPLEAALRG